LPQQKSQYIFKRARGMITALADEKK